MTSGMDEAVTLVLGGGGQFGAWQAGFCLALEGRLPIRAVLGASIGAVNGWAVASGVPAAEWAARWRNPGPEARLPWRVPHRWLGGLLDSTPFDEFLRDLCSRHQPRLPYGCALVRLRWLRQRLVLYPDAGWRHLAASCAMFGMLPSVRLEGETYIDGGTRAAVPLWAAAEMGPATVLAVDIFHAGEWQEYASAGGRTLIARPGESLGSFLDMLNYDSAHAAAWVEMGRRAGEEALRRWW
jgi:NTE family protein